MKGLIIKDLLLLKNYCRMILVLTVFFMLIAIFGENQSFFLLYPCILSSMMPMTLIAYDERERWNEYSQTLPYTKTQLVSVKYIIGLTVSGVVGVLVLMTRLFLMLCAGSFFADELLFLFAMIVGISLIGPAIMLPFIFKFGIEKGRIFYYFSIGVGSALCLFLGYGEEFSINISENIISCSVVGIAIVLYALSWLLSVSIYKKRSI